MPPVFDCLQYAKTEGEDLGDLVTCVTSGRQRVTDGGRGVPDRCNSQTLHWSASSLPNNELYWRCLYNVTVSSSWTRYYKSLENLCRAPPPVCLHIITSHTVHVTTFYRTLLSVFAYCKRSKTGEGLGTRLRSTHVHSDRWILSGLLHWATKKLHLQTTKHASKWFIWSKLPSVRLTSAKESPDDAMLKFPACWFSINIRGVASKAIIRRRGQQVRSSGGRTCKSRSADQDHHVLYLWWLRQVGRAGGGVGCAFCEWGAAVVEREELCLLRAGGCRHYHWCPENQQRWPKLCPYTISKFGISSQTNHIEKNVWWPPCSQLENPRLN